MSFDRTRSLSRPILDFELDRMLKDRRTTEGYWTAGYETYLSFGLVQPARGQSARVDEILRRRPLPGFEV